MKWTIYSKIFQIFKFIDLFYKIWWNPERLQITKKQHFIAYNDECRVTGAASSLQYLTRVKAKKSLNTFYKIEKESNISEDGIRLDITPIFGSMKRCRNNSTKIMNIILDDSQSTSAITCAWTSSIGEATTKCSVRCDVQKWWEFIVAIIRFSDWCVCFSWKIFMRTGGLTFSKSNNNSIVEVLKRCTNFWEANRLDVSSKSNYSF